MSTKNKNNKDLGQGSRSDTTRPKVDDDNSVVDDVTKLKQHQSRHKYIVPEKKAMSMGSLTGLVDYVKNLVGLKDKQTNKYTIIMQTRGGRYDIFYINTNLPYFEYKDAAYIIDTDIGRFDIETGTMTLYYHQDINVPFRIDFDINDIKKTLMDEEDVPDKAINPFNLKSFLISETIEKVLKGGELLDDIALMKKLVMAILGSNLLLLVLVLRTLGYI